MGKKEVKEAVRNRKTNLKPNHKSIDWIGIWKEALRRNVLLEGGALLSKLQTFRARKY